jgi:hypothetical protein
MFFLLITNFPRRFTQPVHIENTNFRRRRYIEIELGPHGHHLVLLLDGVRNAVAKLLPIKYNAAIGKSLF